MATSNKHEDISKELKVEDISINKGMAMTICANCGKEGSNPNTCNKCDLAVRYCNAACKKKHRSKHKQDCERRVAELHEEELERKKRVAELHDEKLFKQPPPSEDCPICMLLLPSLDSGLRYSACCGKIICSGCIHAVEKRDGGIGLCPFCRTPTPDINEEIIKQMKKRVEFNDAEGIYSLGCCYFDWPNRLPQYRDKALELWHQAAELGNTASYHNIGMAYLHGRGVERDMKKAVHYWELAAMGGHVATRHNLGISEGLDGNIDRALKHFMIAAEFGDNDSLKQIKKMFKNGQATKDDYAKALRAYQTYLVEIKSPQRDEAAAYRDEYKYY